MQSEVTTEPASERTGRVELVQFRRAFALNAKLESEVNVLSGEPVALAIRDHQRQRSDLWERRELVSELHDYVERFDATFDLGIPTPIIAVARLRSNVLGMYRLGRNDFGARTTITLNELYLPAGPVTALTLEVLLHECVHAWEEWNCGRERGGWYHTVAWRRKMAEIGIIADEHGYTIRREPRFIEYLAKFGVRFNLPDGSPEMNREARGTRSPLLALVCPRDGYRIWSTFKWLHQYDRLPACPCGQTFVPAHGGSAGES
jgi:hypothetical protein